MTLNSSIPLWIFGLDTGDVEMIRHWVRQGHLPAIGSLLERGCWALVGGLRDGGRIRRRADPVQWCLAR